MSVCGHQSVCFCSLLKNVDKQPVHMCAFPGQQRFLALNWFPVFSFSLSTFFLFSSLPRYGELLVPYYNELAEAARSSGLLTFGHDHVGHGRSEGERVQV